MPVGWAYPVAAAAGRLAAKAVGGNANDRRGTSGIVQGIVASALSPLDPVGAGAAAYQAIVRIASYETGKEGAVGRAVTKVARVADDAGATLLLPRDKG